MMLSRRLVTLATLLVTAQATRLAAQGPNLEDSVRALESQRAEALLKADTVALSQLLADDFVEISRLGTLRTKADNMREIASGALRLTSVRYDSLSVRLYGDVAVLQGIADNTGTFRGFPFTGKIRYTRVFVRRDGRWRAVAMQQTSMQ
jgi:ketosteroid isomerase-like protein